MARSTKAATASSACETRTRVLVPGTLRTRAEEDKYIDRCSENGEGNMIWRSEIAGTPYVVICPAGWLRLQMETGSDDLSQKLDYVFAHELAHSLESPAVATCVSALPGSRPAWKHEASADHWAGRALAIRYAPLGKVGARQRVRRAIQAICRADSGLEKSHPTAELRINRLIPSADSLRKALGCTAAAGAGTCQAQ